MAIGFIDRLQSNNPDAFGIVAATEVSGHRSIADFTSLYGLPDAILSLSKTNTGNDAIGQIWYVISEKKHYQLVDWSNRHKAEGWQVFNSGGDTTSLETRIIALEKKITELEKQIGGMIQPIPITNIELDSQQMLFTNPTPQTITATITPANATEKLTWEVNDSNVVITPSDDTLSCEVMPTTGALDGEYLLTVSSPSGLSESVQVIFDGVENVVVPPTVTLGGITEAEIDSEVVITANFKNMLTEYCQWYVNSGATIVSQSRESCTIRINDDSTLVGKTINVDYEYDIVADGSDTASVSHSILVKAKEVPDEKADPVITLTGRTSVKAGETVIIDASVDDYVDDYYLWFIEPEESIEVQSSTAADIVFKVKEDVAAGTVIKVGYEVSGSTTQFVEKILEINVVEESSDITDLDMGGASTNATSVIDLGNASTNATSVIDLGNANV